MILTDREIQVALRANQIAIDPRPEPDAYSSTSVDLTLSDVFRIWKQRADVNGIEPVVVSPGVAGFKFDDVANEHLDTIVAGNQGHVIEPNAFVLGWTRERVSLPIEGRLAARVEGKSSLARCGVGVHVTAPTIHAGFVGQIQLEIFNHSTVRVRLLPGMKVCQLILEATLGTPDKGYRGMFAGQTARKKE